MFFDNSTIQCRSMNESVSLEATLEQSRIAEPLQIVAAAIEKEGHAYLLIFRNDSDQNHRTLFRRQAVRVLTNRSIRNCAKNFIHPIRDETVINLISF